MNSMSITPEQKRKLAILYPELAPQLLQESNSDVLSKIFGSLQMLKGEPGDKGYTPVKGKDYYTESEIDDFIKKVTPQKGVHYFDGERGDRGKDYVLTSKDKNDIASQIEVPVIEKIIEKTEIIKEIIPKEIDVSVIKGAVSKKEFEIEKKTILDGMILVDGRIKAIDQRWRGGGLSKVSHDTTLTGDGTPSNPLGVIGGVTLPFTEVGFGDGANAITGSANFTYDTTKQALRIGRNSYATGNESYALGFYSQATGAGSLAGGLGGNGGNENQAFGDGSFAWGNDAKASDYTAVAMGHTAHATGIKSVAIGDNVFASAQNSYTIGYTNTASGVNSMALGNNNVSSGVNSFTAGENLSAGGDTTILFGSNISSSISNSIHLGVDDIIISIRDTGRVGINNTDPQYALDISGEVHTNSNLLVDGDFTAFNNAFFGNNLTSDGILSLWSSGDSAYQDISAQTGQTTFSTNISVFGNVSANRLILGGVTNGTLIDASDGGTGLGARIDTYGDIKLGDVSGNSTGNYFKIINDDATFNDMSISNPNGQALNVRNDFLVLNGTTYNNYIRFGSYGDGAGFFAPSGFNAAAYFATQAIPIKFQDNNSGVNVCFMDMSNHRLGVLNDTPTYTLDVGGDIRGTNYRSSDASLGISTTITSASLVGKTITIKNGLITGFA